MAGLIPPDENQCQAEEREGSFMTHGPRSMIRCSERPDFIATENKPGSDGQIGSMSVCQRHREIMEKLGFDCSYAKIARKGKASKKAAKGDE
jgi:hypothetical protein